MKTAGIALGCALTLGALLWSTTTAAEPAATGEVIALWPGPPPAEPGGLVDEEKAKVDSKTHAVTSLTNVTKPTLTVYKADAAHANGAAVLVAPGGGYTNLAWDHEGTKVAEWLNTLGVSAFVLKYRVPRRPGQTKNAPPAHALADAQRALSLVRSKAADFGIDPERLGMLGFSAGGHLTAWASTNFDQRGYETIDDADKVSCRPSFAVLIYPGGVIQRGTTELASEIRVTAATPPSFLVHAHDDAGSPVNSVAYYLALKKAGVSAEMHIYSTGGHGFGMRPGPNANAAWPQRCAEWMRDRGLLKSSGENAKP